jgi:hypothetical protein
VQEEVRGERDLTYSGWHRTRSIARYTGMDVAKTLGMIDVDGVEYDPVTKMPVALIETARDVGQTWKPAQVLQNLAGTTKPELPVYVVLYSLSEEANPADPRVKDICRFRVRRMHPSITPWVTFSPEQYAAFLVNLRKRKETI